MLEAAILQPSWVLLLLLLLLLLLIWWALSGASASAAAPASASAASAISLLEVSLCRKLRRSVMGELHLVRHREPLCVAYSVLE